MEYIAEIREYKTEAITELTTEYECIDKVRFFSKLSVSFQEQVSKSSWKNIQQGFSKDKQIEIIKIFPVWYVFGIY